MKNNIYQRDPKLPWRKFGDRALIIDANPEFVHIANDVALRIWELLEGDIPLQDVITKICDEFDAAPDIIANDVCELVQDLQKRGLIQDVSMA